MNTMMYNHHAVWYRNAYLRTIVDKITLECNCNPLIPIHITVLMGARNCCQCFAPQSFHAIKQQHIVYTLFAQHNICFEIIMCLTQLFDIRILIICFVEISNHCFVYGCIWDGEGRGRWCILWYMFRMLSHEIYN